MKLKELKFHYNLAVRSKSVQELIKFVSTDIWNRIYYVTNNVSKTRKNLKLHEVTITENLIYEVHKFTNFNSIVLLQIEEALDEESNGNDIELILRFDQGYLKIPVQAKLLTSDKTRENGAYKYYAHYNKKGFQPKLLEAYAQRCGSHIAFYLFYNYIEGSKFINEAEYLYGCSVASTQSMKGVVYKNKSRRFSELHPHPGKPFYHLFKPPGSGGSDDFGGGDDDPENPQLPGSPSAKFNDVIDFYRSFGIDIDENFVFEKLTFWTLAQLTEEEGWKEIGNPNDRPEMKSNPIAREINGSSFNPKYRLIAMPISGTDKQSGGLAEVLAPSEKIIKDKKEQERNEQFDSNKKTLVGTC